jgi:hypothetical protein
MARQRSWKVIAACALGVGMLAFLPGEASASHYSVRLNGSGPVYTETMKPGRTTVTVTVSNRNNNNVGYDLIDQGNGNVIANGTIKSEGKVTKLGTAHDGRTYKLRLRCQEPRWNRTKCDAVGSVDWPFSH